MSKTTFEALLKSDLGPEQRASLLAQMGRDAQPRPARRITQAARPVPTEHEEQADLIQWADGPGASVWPEVGLLYAIPNGQYRRGQRPEPGIRAGVPDLFLPVPRGGAAGLFIELKRADRSNGTSPEQDAWIEQLQGQGYRAVVAYGAIEAIEAIQNYMREDAG